MRQHTVASVRLELQLALHTTEDEKPCRRKSARGFYPRLTIDCGRASLEFRPSPKQRSSYGSAIDEIVQIPAKISIVVGTEQITAPIVDDVPVTEVDARRAAKQTF